MRNLIKSVLLSVLVIAAVNLYASRLFNMAERQQGETQNTSPEQQQPPQASHPQSSSTATAQSVTGCLVQTGNGYSLKTDTDVYPIETTKDLSQYVNKKIKVTGILEHHNAAAPSTASGNTIAVTDLRLRVIASVVGDCKPQSQ